MPATAQIADCLAKNASRYFPGLAGLAVRVELRRASRREASHLYYFDVRAPGHCYPIVVKVPSGSGGTARGKRPMADRPRLAPPCDAAKKYRFEHDALATIHEHFFHLNDRRFGALHILDMWPAQRAIVMRASSQPRLSSLLRRVRILHRGATLQRLTAALAHTGAWLRTYHQLPPLPHTRPRHSRRSDFLDTLRQFLAFQPNLSRDAIRFQSMAERLQRAALRHLPAELPLGLGHGDFAPRNVFVGSDGRIAVFDTLARWQAPIYEDLGSFLVELKRNLKPEVGLSRLFSAPLYPLLEQTVLEGYFAGETVPRPAVRLFEIAWLLQRSCTHVQACKTASGLRRVTVPWRRMMSKWYQQWIESLLLSLEDN